MRNLRAGELERWQGGLTAVALILILSAPMAIGAASKFTDTDPAVTGHTIFARHLVDSDKRRGNGLPTDFAAVAGYFTIEGKKEAAQRECVVWFDGKNLDQRPAADTPPATGGGNGFPSDEGAPAGANQDYDFDRDVSDCPAQEYERRVNATGAFATVVEKGDCDPANGRDWIFRGHLDFVDPNNIYHEVQEYSYVCAIGGPMNVVPNPAFPGQDGGLSEALRDLLPPGLIPESERHCNQVPPPHEEIDPKNQSIGQPHQFVSCNARVQAMFREMVWITPIHERVWDPTIQQYYNFALQIDTCDGTQCTDGSKDSFDDTSRSRVSHRDAPEDEVDVMRGNSYDSDPSSVTFGTHRTNCRSVYVRWQRVTERPGPDDRDCYPEDHKTAAIDIYAMFGDPTGGLWAANSNGLTGMNAYGGPGTPTGPLYRG